MTCYLYIAETEDRSTIKVGITIDLIQRVTRISYSSAMPIEIVWREEFETVDIARATEAAMHRKLEQAGFRSHGEWFKCSAVRALLILGLDLQDQSGPRSTWPKGTKFRPPPMITEVPLPDSVVQEDLEWLTSNKPVPSQK